MVNCFEIYKENIVDLFVSPENQKPLEIKEESNGGTYVANLAEMKISTANEFLKIMEFAGSKRKQGATEMND